MSNIIKMHAGEFLTTSKVIKPRAVETENEETDESSLTAVKYNELIAQAEAEAQSIIGNAAKEAEQIRIAVQHEKESWSAEKQQLSESAWNEGYQQGLAEGREAGRNEYQRQIGSAIDVLNHSKIESLTYIEKAEQTILKLAMTSAEAILGTHLSAEPEQFIEPVKKALEEFKNEKEVAIYVHPSKFELLTSARNILESVFPREVQCYIYPDIELGDNDCMIETDTGRIAYKFSKLYRDREK